MSFSRCSSHHTLVHHYSLRKAIYRGPKNLQRNMEKNPKCFSKNVENIFTLYWGCFSTDVPWLSTAHDVGGSTLFFHFRIRGWSDYEGIIFLKKLPTFSGFGQLVMSYLAHPLHYTVIAAYKNTLGNEKICTYIRFFLLSGFVRNRNRMKIRKLASYPWVFLLSRSSCRRVKRYLACSGIEKWGWIT